MRSALNVPVPVRRGAAVVAVAGGAFSLAGAGFAAAPAAPPSDAGAALRLAAPDAPAAVALAADAAGRTDSAGTAFSAATLVSAVRGAEDEARQRVDEHREEARRRGEQARREAEERADSAREQAREEARRKARDERERERADTRRAAPAAAPSAGADCGLATSGLGAVKPHVREAAEFLGCANGEPTMHGVAGRGGKSDHPGGRAVDFMTNRATGDALAECALRNKEALGITYVIWRQRINHGSGWKGMEDRGGATANHMDHVHVSFGSGGGPGTPTGC